MYDFDGLDPEKVIAFFDDFRLSKRHRVDINQDPDWVDYEDAIIEYSE